MPMYSPPLLLSLLVLFTFVPIAPAQDDTATLVVGGYTITDPTIGYTMTVSPTVVYQAGPKVIWELFWSYSNDEKFTQALITYMQAVAARWRELFPTGSASRPQQVIDRALAPPLLE